MPLSPLLKETLACPKCKGELEFQEEQDRIVCRACRLVFRVVDGCPQMVLEQAQPLEG